MTATLFFANLTSKAASSTVKRSSRSISRSNASSATSCRSHIGTMVMPTLASCRKSEPDAASHTTKGNTDGQEPN